MFRFTDEIFSVTTQMQQEEIEHVEEVEQQSGHIQSTTVCLDEATIIEQDEEEEEIEEEIEEEEVDEMFTLELSEASECEDKEYLGKSNILPENHIRCHFCDLLFVFTAEFVSAQTSCPYPGLFVCNLCRKEFKHSKWLQTHMKSHSNWIKVSIIIHLRYSSFSNVPTFAITTHFSSFCRPIVKSSHSVRFALEASKVQEC